MVSNAFLSQPLIIYSIFQDYHLWFPLHLEGNHQYTVYSMAELDKLLNIYFKNQLNEIS